MTTSRNSKPMTRTASRTRVLITAAALIATSAGPALATMIGPTAAAAAPAARHAPADAMIRAAHFSPTTPGVDVYLGRFSGGQSPTKLWLSRVGYGAVSGYQALTPGVYTVAMRAAGAAADSRPMLTWTLHAQAGDAYTVAGVGADNAIRGVVVDDDLTTPPKGEGRVRVVQAASRAGVVTVTSSGGQVIAPATQFATVSRYATLPAGRWTVQARPAGLSTDSAANAASGPVTVRAGEITSILLLDAKSAGVTLRTVVDSASSGVVPRDSVDTGLGGTAVHRDPASSATTSAGGYVAAMLAMLAVAALAGYGLRGRFSRAG